MTDEKLIEIACEAMHDAYEAAAVAEGWETQERSRRPWSDVPEANKRTMRIAVRAALAVFEAHRADEWEYGIRWEPDDEMISFFRGDGFDDVKRRERAAHARGNPNPRAVRRRAAGPWELIPEQEARDDGRGWEGLLRPSPVRRARFGGWAMSKRHCPHSSLRGIYGDEINRTPGGRRLECRDCGRLLDGPVMLAMLRRYDGATISGR